MRNVNIEPIFNMFKRKRKSRGAMWASLFGLGLSAAVYGVTRGKRKISALPLQNMQNNMQTNMQNMVKTFTPKTNIGMMDNAALTEFSEELLESALRNKRQ
ncbi:MULTISPECIES: hypothetical protein [Bacillus]|uniref:hypothetical protein n=1 Tax=Bacillus TaxID=1386 RepID=UPI00047E2087|nr:MULTISPECIES: hypothetical protein [Bacillus]MED1467734.1 hypothetical protein [Bacillus salipaludis]